MKKFLLALGLVLMACGPGAPVDRLSYHHVQDAPTVAQPTPAPVSTWQLGAPSAPPELPKPLPPIRVWIDPDAIYLEQLQEAVAAWAETFKGVREWVLVDATAEEINTDDPKNHPSPADVAIYEIGPYGGTCAGSNAGTGQGQVYETTALGCTWGIGGLWHNDSGEAMPVFLIDPSEYDKNPKLTAMHEIGHLLGLTHKDGGIMQAGATTQALAADWECPDPDSVSRLESQLHISGLHSCPVPY